MAKQVAEIDASEDAYTKKALDWFVDLSMDGQTCPVCNAEFFDGTEAEKRRNLIQHGKAKHMARISIGYPTRNIDAISAVEDEAETPLDAAGLEIVETLGRYDALAIPDDIKKQATRDGASVRWVSGNNMERFKHHGMEAVKDDQGNPVKSGDLMLYRIPNRLRNRYAEQRARMNNSAPAARKEDLERKIEGHARNMYDAAVKKGLGRDVAKSLAHAAERGLATGVLNVRRG
jgi:hypothetical protein